MKTRDISLLLFAAGLVIACTLAFAGQADIGGRIVKGEKTVIAVTDMHGSGAAEQYMDTFNKALWDELDSSGQIKLAPKTSYPLQVPQQEGDFYRRAKEALDSLRTTGSFTPNSDWWKN